MMRSDVRKRLQEQEQATAEGDLRTALRLLAEGYEQCDETLGSWVAGEIYDLLEKHPVPWSTRAWLGLAKSGELTGSGEARD